MIQKVLPQSCPEIPHQMKANNPPVGGVMSLDDGAHYFAENRKTNKVVNHQSLKDLVDNFDLPKDVADRLRGA